MTMTREEIKDFVVEQISNLSGDDRVMTAIIERITEKWVDDADEARQDGIRDAEYNVYYSYDDTMNTHNGQY